MKLTNNNKAGFSLVELMVVVAIIGILSTIAVPQFQRFQAKARQSSAKVELTGLYTAQSAFQAEYASYHADLPYVGFVPSGFPLNPENGCLIEDASVTSNVASPTAGQVRLYRIGINAEDPDSSVTGKSVGGSPDLAVGGTWPAKCQIYAYDQNALATDIGNAKDDELTGQAPVAMTTTVFTAYAKGRVSGKRTGTGAEASDVYDVWSMDNNKVMVNTTVGY